MFLSVMSVLVVAQSSSEIPEGLMNNPVNTRDPRVNLGESSCKLWWTRWQWGQDFWGYFSFIPVGTIPALLHIYTSFTSHRRDTSIILATDRVLKYSILFL